MYDNNYPNTNHESQDSSYGTQNNEQNAGQNQNGNLYGGQNTGGYYGNGYQNNPYGQNRTANPYGNRAGYYQGAGGINGVDSTAGRSAAGGTDGGGAQTGAAAAGNTNAAAGGTTGTSAAGSYQYGSTYPNDYAQSAAGKNGKKAAKKHKSVGGYVKRALVSVSLGLFFGVFAGAGLYGVQKVTDMFEPAEKETTEVSGEAISGEVTPETDGGAADAEGAGDSAQAQLHLTQSITGTVTDVSEVAKEVMPAIVSINNHYTERMSYFGQEIVNQADSSGSGIIVGQNDTELLIATNYHVIQDAEKLTIQFNDGGEAEAFVKGADSKMDLAVIAVAIDGVDKATLDKISVATLGDSDALEVGEPAIAIGNSLGYGQSVTTGVISALNRTIELSDGASGTFIQTDAAINPGNSGGALLNMKGAVIGINSNKIGGSAVEGMGYAIPISAASPIIAEMMLRETKNKVAEDERGYLGISGISVTEYVSEAYGMPKGVFVSQVYENTAASEAGLRKGDIITEFDGVAIYSMDELQRELEFHAKGETVELTVMSADVNGYTDKKVQLTLGNKVSE